MVPKLAFGPRTAVPPLEVDLPFLLFQKNNKLNAVFRAIGFNCFQVLSSVTFLFYGELR